jgi:hypothetical protein
MMPFYYAIGLLATIVLVPLSLDSCAASAAAQAGAAPIRAATDAVRVAGTGFDDLKNAIVHWKKPTATGMVQQSTEIVELNGDLTGGSSITSRLSLTLSTAHS